MRLTSPEPTGIHYSSAPESYMLRYMIRLAGQQCNHIEPSGSPAPLDDACPPGSRRARSKQRRERPLPQGARCRSRSANRMLLSRRGLSRRHRASPAGVKSSGAFGNSRSVRRLDTLLPCRERTALSSCHFHCSPWNCTSNWIACQALVCAL